MEEESEPESNGVLPESNGAVPDVKQVALTISRFYLRNYLANLDSTKSSSIPQDSNSIDPNDNPDNLADMVEQVQLAISTFSKSQHLNISTSQHNALIIFRCVGEPTILPVDFRRSSGTSGFRSTGTASIGLEKQRRSAGEPHQIRTHAGRPSAPLASQDRKLILRRRKQLLQHLPEVQRRHTRPLLCQTVHGQ